ncbi:helix-turn-helix transcriptional regulator [Herbaspirillum rubrisubalbicans]|uniref:AraC family transcriptional regulator n=1 Tax=Herbaspirillum rubrisubalbicans TaxID=80842 RepID=A0AAD0XI38_9BURK|nr:helix-turn-helix transcriptional regulator [Herbaspirillum rubrisubalbicans]AYR25130.1 AraC family transcriptional regulator [Herbaspirillum rubrisubalbicans]
MQNEITILPFAHGPRPTLTRIRARHEQQLRQVFIGQASICHVRQGKKRVQWGKRHLLCGQDCLLLIAPGTQINVANLPRAGEYAADMVSLPPTLIDRFRLHYPGQGVPAREAGAISSISSVTQEADLLRAWRHLLECLRDEAALPLQCQAAEGLLLALSLAGAMGGLLRERGDAISHHIEQHLLMLPPEERSLERVADAFHCSVSTLRRRLAREQTGFRELLDKVQLGLALEQLQASSLPIADIAATCGYDSASRFAMRFRQHYGISPSELRQTLP